jgi:hypothetical protein
MVVVGGASQVRGVNEARNGRFAKHCAGVSDAFITLFK